MSSDAFKLRKTSQDSRNHLSPSSCRTRLTVSQKQSNNGGEMTQAEIAKLHYMFLKCLKIFCSLEGKPFKEVYIFMFAFKFSLLAATLFQCIYENCWLYFLLSHTRERLCFQILSRYFKITMKVIKLFFVFYVEQKLCILNLILMLEHALTEYCVSICFVNLLYSNCLLPEGKWWN